MKAVLNALAGATVVAALSTGLMYLLDQRMMVGPAVLATVTLAGLAIGVWYVDHRVRFMLRSLCDQLMQMAFEQDKPLVYNAAFILREDIDAGVKLVTASHELGRLSNQLDVDFGEALA